MKPYFKTLIHVLICALPLLLVAIYNGYPLVTSDSGAYINNAFMDDFPIDRPIFYSYFIKYASFKISLWFVIALQAYLLAFLIIQFNKYVFHITRLIHHVIIMMLCVIFTGVAWYSGQIMPDIFTAILVLASVLFFIVKEPSKYLFLGLVLVSLIMHTSHVLMSILMSGTLFLYLLFFNKRRKVSSRNWLLFNTVIILAILMIATSNYKAHHGFVLSPTSHVFLMAKMSENGILEKYLAESCEKVDYKLCQYKTELPEHAWDFIWTENGVFQKTGGWDSSKTEYNKILKGMARSPHYLSLIVKETFLASLSQFSMLTVGDGLFPYLENSNPFYKVQENFGHELEAYTSSKQNQNTLTFNSLNKVYQIFFFTVLVILLVLIVIKKEKKLFAIFAFIIIFLYFNALITGGLANILPRLNSRAIWIASLFGISYLFSLSQRVLKKREVK